MTHELKGVRIARVATIFLSVTTHLQSQLEAIGEAGASITIISSYDKLMESLCPPINCQFQPINIAREINIFSDIISLFQLIKLFKKEKFDIIHSITPKAGLLCAIAAKIARTPIRIHTYTGQTWVTTSGIKKIILKNCDKLIGYINTHCYADSFSQRAFLIKQKIIKESKISVLGSGSLSGVNLKRFNPNNYSQLQKEMLCESLNIQVNSFKILFVGRITQDKGVFELIDAMEHLIIQKLNTILLIVGPFEHNIEQKLKTYAQQRGGHKIIFTGFSNEPEIYMAIADILCLPSYREGFGSVVIEAAAMGLPTVGTNIYGLTDAIVHGETGLLVEPKNSVQLTQALKQLVVDESLRTSMKYKARTRVLNEFDSQKLSNLLVSDYVRFIAKNTYLGKNSNVKT